MSAHRTAPLPSAAPILTRRWLARGDAAPLEVVLDPDADGIRLLAAATPPGSTVHILACRDGEAAAIRQLLACGLLFLRSERRDEGSLLVAAIRPEHPVCAALSVR